MNRYKKAAVWLCSLCLLFQTCAVHVQAADREAYGYTITFYAGNHGTFAGQSQVSVDNSRTGSAWHVENQGAAVVVRDLQYGDRVSFDAAVAGAVTLGENSKYYVKGIRQGGRDNDTVGMSSFEVKGDQDYVVAYGIRGDLTSYVVRYEDTSGNPLMPERSYYGNVGDRPVVAFLYIEGYEPQAYNLTRTLSQNAAENVFTFQYARVRTGGGGTTGGGGGAAGGGGDAAGGAGETSAADAGAPGTGAAAPGGAAVPGAGAGATAAVPGGAGGAGAVPAGGAAPGQEVPDTDVPQAEGPQELQELDDEDVPLAGLEPDAPAAPGSMLYPIVVGVSAAAALLLLVFLWMKRRKGEKEEDET